jgi:hypothetical protein
MKAVLVFVVVACGPGIKQIAPDVTLAGRDALVKASNDPASMRKLLRHSVVNGGLWFDDARCKTFPVGEVPQQDYQRFAECLVELHLVPSAREDTLGDVVVMTYEPGFEVEVRVVPELDGPRLTWIGYASRAEGDALPTISGDALEAHRLAGERDGPLDPDVAKKILDDKLATIAAGPKPPPDWKPEPDEPSPPPTPFAFSWIKVCVDATGAVTSARPFLTTSVIGQEAFVAATQTWKFRPFMVRGQPLPVCAMVRMTVPAKVTHTETLPAPPPPPRPNKMQPISLAQGASLLEGKRIAGTKMIYPDDTTKLAIQKAGMTRVKGSFRVCIDESGAVESVLPIRSTGVAPYDRRIITAIHDWRYSPFMINNQPIAVCTMVRFIYTQKSPVKIIRH